MGNQSVKEDLPQSCAVTSAPRRKLERVYENLFAANSSLESNYITEVDFKSLFSASHPLKELLLRNFYTMAPCLDDSDNPAIHREDFISFGVKILDLTSVQDQTDFYYEIFLLGKPSWSKLDLQTLLRVCMDLEFSKLPNITGIINDQLILNAMEKSLFSNKEMVEKGDFNYWISRHTPRMLHCLHPYITTALSSDKPAYNRAEACAPEELLQHIIDDHYLMSLSVLWALHTYIPTSYTTAVEIQGSSMDIVQSISLRDIVGSGGWQLLYDSNTQGLSINRFEHHVLRYAAATLMFVQFEEYLYCVGSDTEYSEKTQRWGGSGCFLLQITPQYRIVQAGPGMIYLNIQDRKSPKGLYVGKDARSTMLNIDCDFSTVQHYGIDMPLQRIEVWGCGGRNAFDAQNQQRRWEHGEAEKCKNRKLKIDDWADSPDRQLLEMGGVQTEHAER